MEDQNEQKSQVIIIDCKHLDITSGGECKQPTERFLKIFPTLTFKDCVEPAMGWFACKPYYEALAIKHRVEERNHKKAEELDAALKNWEAEEEQERIP